MAVVTSGDDPSSPMLWSSAYRPLLEGLWKKMARTGKSIVWFPNIQVDLEPGFRSPSGYGGEHHF